MLRSRLRTVLEGVEYPIGRVANLAIAALVLLSSVIFVATTYPLPPQVRTILDGINTAILLIFSVEYLLRLWCAEDRQRYFLSLYSLIDLVAIAPFFLGQFDVSFILIFRWFRILRLLRYIEGRTILGYVSSEDSVILARILFTLLTIVFVYSGLIYQVEHAVNPQAFRTLLDAFYFAVATMTTVGFGDITPTSEVGRLLTILMIWTGIALIPWQVGELIKQILKTARKVEKPCPGCGTEFHDADAVFCRACGAALTAKE
ncbi:MAG: ion transporter [Synechococcales bacterium]|nr:ion transporter [Synechococcales bacterium]